MQRYTLESKVRPKPSFVLRYFSSSKKTESFLLMERLILPKRNSTWVCIRLSVLEKQILFYSASTLQPQIIGVDVFDASPALLPSSC